MPRVVVIVQARLASTRLPRKALAKIAGRPLIEHVLERAAAIRDVKTVTLALPPFDADLFLETLGPAWRDHLASPCHLESDVLGRFDAVARHEEADIIIRVTGDCPLLAPDVADLVLQRFREERADYASNDTTQSGYPDGLDVEVFTRELLVRADRDASEPSDREHVTPIMRRLPGVRMTLVHSPIDDARWKLSVDTQADLDRVRQIYARLEPGEYSWAATRQAAAIVLGKGTG